MNYIWRIKQRITKTTAVVILGSMLLSSIIFLSIFELQSAKAAKPRILNYAVVSIQAKDTLWGIATRYYSEEYGSVNAYIKEIKRCNSLTSDKIQSGTSIIVPIYVDLSKKDNYSIKPKE